jgi:hypothetical protein
MGAHAFAPGSASTRLLAHARLGRVCCTTWASRQPSAARPTASASTATSTWAWPWRSEICRRFRFSNDETRQILALIENHMRFADAERMKDIHAQALLPPRRL